MAAAMAVGAVGACASIVSSTESEVTIRTSPDSAQCELKGHRGYSASVTTPATLSIPTEASPVTVSCRASGYKSTVYTLDATADGWIWGNSAFMVVTGGVAVLGALVDESRSAGKAYQTDVQYQLDPDRPRPVKVKDRSGGTELNLRAR